MIAEEKQQQKTGAAEGPGEFHCCIRYWTVKATSSMTNEVCRLESSLPRKRI